MIVDGQSQYESFLSSQLVYSTCIINNTNSMHANGGLSHFSNHRARKKAHNKHMDGAGNSVMHKKYGSPVESESNNSKQNKPLLSQSNQWALIIQVTPSSPKQTSNPSSIVSPGKTASHPSPFHSSPINIGHMPSSSKEPSKVSTPLNVC